MLYCAGIRWTISRNFFYTVRMRRKIIEIDCRKRVVAEEEMTEDYELLWGRGLSSTLVAERGDPGAHPLGPSNPLVFAAGMAAGSLLSSGNRLSAGAKSPLTGGIKESNAGGTAAFKLGRLGVKALVLKDVPDEPSPSMGIRISRDGVALEDLSFVRGKNAYETARLLYSRYGESVGLLLIGSAGERRLLSSCISATDLEGEPCRNFGRGGLGAVMGSKGVKAIIIDDEGCDDPYAGDAGVKGAISEFRQRLRENPVTGENFPKYGTTMILSTVNALGGLPTRGFSEGAFEDAEALYAESIRETILKRGGRPAHPCMPGCVMQCSNKYVREDGSPLVGSFDYETVCLMGSNLGLSSLDEIAELNYLCNDIGVDTIETGNALGVLSEAGIFSFGDFEEIRSLVEEIGKGSPIGRIAGSGAGVCGEVYGVERVPVVKNQGMAAYDPRAIKGLGVTYSVSPMGADHTAGNAVLLDIDHKDPSVQVEPVRDLHITTTILDILGLCFFSAEVSLGDPEKLGQMVGAFSGRDVSFQELRKISKQLLKTEREFNRKAGLGEETDRLPEFMRREALPPTGSVFDVPEEDLKGFYNF
ncbi:MAG: aldehyde ferredoxin oxidoreductase C-terminal domain-containing protein [Spirochaetia bacterium]